MLLSTMNTILVATPRAVYSPALHIGEHNHLHWFSSLNDGNI